MEGDEVDNPVSRFNETISHLIRLNNLYQQCNEHSSKGNLSRWKGILDALWRELSSSAAKLDENIKDVEKKWVAKRNTIDKKFAQIKDRDEAYTVLNEKEEFLRLLADKAGKGTDWEDNDGGFFD